MSNDQAITIYKTKVLPIMNYMYKCKGKQDHQNSMSGRTRLLMQLYLIILHHTRQRLKEVYILKGDMHGTSYLLEFEMCKLMTCSKTTKNMNC